jgi:hypothetical protein
MRYNRVVVVTIFLALLGLFVGSQPAWTQTTVSQGSIQGTITDSTGAIISGASITITNQDTGAVLNLQATSDGTYSSGGLFPGKYTVRVSAPGFKTTEVAITVQVTVTSSGNIKLDVGTSSTVVEVQGSTVTVNTEQSTVQGVLTAEQIDHLPIDGRNFLDLAQLEPGVQIQDGQDFDPTKAGYSSVSINGVFGRTPRIELDGLDISDETVGTTTQNIGLGSIEEFNIQRSSLDMSTELTSAGAVNVTTRSGTNAFHGQGFYNFRDRNAGLAGFPGSYLSPTDYEATGTYFQRNNYGGRIGGPIWKDKLFFFIDAERMKQDGLDAVSVASPFSALSGGFSSPFRDTDLTGKVDWQVTQNIHVFYKFTYNWNKSAATYYSGYPVYDTKDNAPSDALGFDYTKGNWSHSIRFGYLKFHNQLVDGTQGASFYNPLPDDGVVFNDIGFFFGPNLLAPQGTYQSNKQIKYDGSKVWAKHIIRFGVSSNRIEGGGFASFFGNAPLLITLASAGPVSGDPSNPLNYPLLTAQLGNGQGYFTEKPGFNLPSGGQSDWRLSWYVGDSWKIKPNLTFTYGLRYNRDTGRTDSDLAPIPCSQISPLIVATGEAPCSGSSLILDQFGNVPGLGDRVRQPDKNFGPQLGFAWDPKGDGKTVIRVGAGLYYENSIFNNTLFDRPAKLATGLFNSVGVLGCGSTSAAPGSVSFSFTDTQSVTSVDGADLATQVCNQPLSVAGPLVADLQTEFQAAVAGHAISNPNYVGNSLALTSQYTGLAAFEPNWRVPRSWQMNAGFQRQLFRGGVLSADYIRNVSLAFPLTVDVNHVGDARYLNKAAALNAIGLTTASFGCGGTTAAAINCAIGAGATIDSFAANGLDSGYAYYGGLGLGAYDVSTGSDLTPDTGAAFPGINPLMGPGDIEEPIGRSVYNALQVSYKQTVTNPVRYINSMDLILSYTLSRFVGNGGDDQNFSALAWDNNDPTHVMGPTSLNRTNSFKFGDTMQITRRGPQLSVIGDFGSPYPTLLSLATQSGEAYPTTGEIFLTDVTGDGSVQDLFNPNGGQGKPGQLGGGGSISVNHLASAIAQWNNNVAGTLTPAGQALVSAGLFTTAQLQALQAVKPWIAPPPPGYVAASIFKEVSTTLAWPIRITEGVSIVPSISAFNVFNMSNYGIPGYSSGIMTDETTGPFPAGVYGVAGSPNGTSAGVNRESLRVGTGSGVFSNGAPRQLEFGLKLNF